jgi:hypothetical protein
MRVNAGGDPDRDDFGLPPVDIEIPDDARELDRDVQAYYRELRALRRRRRANRLRGPLSREGMVLPMLAGCLILALITSTLLIMFAADQTGVPQSPGSTAAPPLSKSAGAIRPRAGQIGGPLPASAILIGGKDVSLRAVIKQPSVLTLVPPDCKCASTLRQLSSQAALAHVAVYLVGTPGGMRELAQLAAQAGQSHARVADDTRDVLGTTYRQHGLTAILVRADGSVTAVADDLTQQPGHLRQVETGLQQLSSAR